MCHLPLPAVLALHMHSSFLSPEDTLADTNMTVKRTPSKPDSKELTNHAKWANNKENDNNENAFELMTS